MATKKQLKPHVPGKATKKTSNAEQGRTDLVIALVGPIGARLSEVARLLHNSLSKDFEYKVDTIRVSELLLAAANREDALSLSAYDRIDMCMRFGNELRQTNQHDKILDYCAMRTVAAIAAKRESMGGALKPRAFIINSLKHPDEVKLLRQIYGNGFYLIGVHCDMDRRRQNLVKIEGMTNDQATDLIGRDQGEAELYGQQTVKTFHLSDFFIRDDPDNTGIIVDIERILDIIFGDPFATPTFDEYAMFMAFASAVRSADMSRQVGAVVANEHNEIMASGANDCPQFGGGLYWLQRDPKTFRYVDKAQGRDYMRADGDPNKDAQGKLIEDIATRIEKAITPATYDVRSILRDSQIKDLTEFGRVVHAEMEALLNCGRIGVSTRGTTLYCTTFPCHNCAKHIVSAGVKRVVYIEPYPKSKAEQFHSESISVGTKTLNKITFEAFVGIGPRRFFDLFAMEYGIGIPKKRRADGTPMRVSWGTEERKTAMPRIPLNSVSYRDVEKSVSLHFL